MGGEADDFPGGIQRYPEGTTGGGALSGEGGRGGDGIDESDLGREGGEGDDDGEEEGPGGGVGEHGPLGGDSAGERVEDSRRRRHGHWHG